MFGHHALIQKEQFRLHLSMSLARGHRRVTWGSQALSLWLKLMILQDTKDTLISKMNRPRTCGFTNKETELPKWNLVHKYLRTF